MTVFTAADAIVSTTEAGYSNNPDDPGNWTGGEVGKGKLLGTKYGIAAASHPTVDIPGLTLRMAQDIRKAEYWDKVAGDRLPPPLALLVYDAAINNGVGRAARWLQEVAGVAQDGVIGDATVRAITARNDGVALLGRYMALRIAFMSRLATWPKFGADADGRPLGWSTRLGDLPFQALLMQTAA